jgi:hypothetical protein
VDASATGGVGGGEALGAPPAEPSTLEAQAQAAAKRVTAATDVLAQSVAQIRQGSADFDTGVLGLGAAFGQLQAQVNAALERLQELGDLLVRLRDPAAFLPPKLGFQNLSEDEKRQLKERLEALEEFLKQATESANGSGTPKQQATGKVKT